jgi:hypothetical protein
VLRGLGGNVGLGPGNRSGRLILQQVCAARIELIANVWTGVLGQRSPRVSGPLFGAGAKAVIYINPVSFTHMTLPTKA